MNVKCEGCRKKIKNQMQKVHGVHSMNIDANEGKVTISSTVDPHVLIHEFAKVGKKAQLLWEQRPESRNQTANIEDKANKPAQTQDAQRDNSDIDPYHKAQLAHLQELVKHRRLKQVDLTYRNIKMTFNDDINGLRHDDDPTIKFSMDKLGEASTANNPPPVNVANGGGSSCPAAAPSDACGSASKTATCCSHDLGYNCGGNNWYEHGNRPLVPPPPYYGYNYPHPNYNVPPATQPYPSSAPHPDAKCGDSDKSCSM
ncbi:hypothetical protein Tsubulata_046148, partial [Turnera subulata]